MIVSNHRTNSISIRNSWCTLCYFNDGNILSKQEPKVYNEITMFSVEQWDAVQKGMNWVGNIIEKVVTRVH